MYIPPSPPDQLLVEGAILEYLQKEEPKTLEDLNQHLFNQWNLFLDPHDTVGNGRTIKYAILSLQDKGHICVSEPLPDGVQEVSATKDPAEQSVQQRD